MRPRLRAKFPALTPQAVQAFLADVLRQAHSITDVPKAYCLPRDPKDEKYINLAIASGARYLVSRDKDLLDLMNEQTPEGRDFRRRFPDLRIIDPPTFVHEMDR